MSALRHRVGHRAIATLAVRADPPGFVHILQADSVFAPSVEQAFLTFQLHGPVDAGRLEVLSTRSGGKPIFARVLQPSELGSGVPIMVQWDGRGSDGAFVTPLLGPFEWRIVVDRGGDELAARADLDVLYAGLRIGVADWTPDGRLPPADDEHFTASRRLRVQYQLNELGYWAGVVGDETDDCLTKAVNRYRVNHPDFFRPRSEPMGGEIDGPLAQALAAGEGKVKFLDVEGGGRPLAPGKTTRLYVEALLEEPADGTRRGADEERLTRPTFAVEAEVLLRTRTGAAVPAPKAVGAVRVNWRVKDVGEDLRQQVLRKSADNPALARKYIEKARKEAGGLDLNCPRSLGGIRTKSTPWLDAALVGDAYAAYPTTADAAKKAIVSRAVSGGSKLKRRRGKAGFVFRPSYIAGDGYRIEAELDFDDEPNAADLEDRHGEITGRTGTIRIWRRLRWAGIVGWTAKPRKKWPWAQVREEFARAYLELELPEDKTSIAITEVIDNADYLAALAEVALPTTGHKLTPAGLWGGPLPKQGKTTSASSYRISLINGLKPKVALLQKDGGLGIPIHRGVLKKRGPGVVVLEFAATPPVDVYKEGGRTVDQKGFRVPPDDPGYAAAVGVAWLLDSIRVTVFETTRWGVLHEVGHTLYLRHYRNITGEEEDGTLVDHPEEHDASDDACVMSYAVPWSGFKDVHFCGRCNLNLRGWDVTLLPERSKGS